MLLLERFQLFGLLRGLQEVVLEFLLHLVQLQQRQLRLLTRFCGVLLGLSQRLLVLLLQRFELVGQG